MTKEKAFFGQNNVPLKPSPLKGKVAGECLTDEVEKYRKMEDREELKIIAKPVLNKRYAGVEIFDKSFLKQPHHLLSQELPLQRGSLFYGQMICCILPMQISNIATWGSLFCLVLNPTPTGGLKGKNKKTTRDNGCLGKAQRKPFFMVTDDY